MNDLCARPLLLCLSVLMVVLTGISSAQASPWTLSQHELVLSTDISFASADEEYLYDYDDVNLRQKQPYSLNGQFRSTTLALGARYGFTDKFEMSVKPHFKQLSYDADPVILDIVEEPLSLDEARSRVIDFDSSRLGAADMNVAGRYNLFRGFVVVTPEVGFKIPLAYDPPQGTFEDLDVTPDEDGVDFTTEDDAVLGDGQIDAHFAMLFGAYLPWTRTFVRADVGYVHRFDDPGDQVFANGKIGQFLTESLIVFGGVRWTETVTDGDAVGQTFVDTNAGADSQDASTFSFGQVEVLPLYLDRSFVIVEAGAIINLGKIELQLSWEEVVDAENFADLRTINLGIVSSFPNATRSNTSEEPEVSENPEPTEQIIEEVIIVPEDEAQRREDGEVIEEEVIIEEEPRREETAPEAGEKNEDSSSPDGGQTQKKPLPPVEELDASERDE